jgi:hypothetical protein
MEAPLQHGSVTTAMPALTFLAVAALVLTALLFVADANLEKSSSPVIVTSQRIGLPEPQYRKATRTLTNTPAPAPDMISQAVRAAQPKSELEQPVTVHAEAHAARAEAPPKKTRVERSAKDARAEAKAPNNPDTQPTNYQPTAFFDRFSIKGY